MVDTVGTVYPFARLSEANKTIITDGVKRTGPIGGVCRVIHIVGSVWRWWLHKYTHRKFSKIRERIWTLYFLAYWKVMRKFTKKWLIDFTKNAVFKFAYYIWTLVYWKQMNVKIRFQWHLMTYNDIWWRAGTISGNNHLLCGWNKYAYGVKGSHPVLKFRMFRRDSLNCGTESGSEERMKQMSNLKLHWLWK